MSNLSKIGSAELSRRWLLRSLALTAVGATMLGTTMIGNRAAMADGQVAQSAVGYQSTPHGAEFCNNCTQFERPSSCKVVAGNISAAGWCKVYEKIST